MCILNMTVKQTTTIKTQNTVFNYAEMLKIELNSIIKIVLKQIKHEITILQQECLFLDKEEIKSAKIVKTVNTKIENNSKKKMIVTRKFFNENIVLILNSAEMKIHMMKKTD